MFGRRTIYTTQPEITRDNVASVVKDALVEHNANRSEIDYLWNYYKGNQPILGRKKEIRPEIMNCIAQNHASEIVAFFSGYLLGEPCTYIRHGEGDGVSKEIDKLNEYMFAIDKASCDKELATWVYATGVGYRMCLSAEDKFADSPFNVDVCDPRTTFIVYRNDFGKPRMLAAQEIKMLDDSIRYCGYTKTHYFETDGTKVFKWEPHTYDDIPIFEYSANAAKMGAFEPVIGMLDAINTVQSNRVDGIESFIAALLVFVNCDIDTDEVDKLRQSGFVKLKTFGENKAEIKLIAEQLDQQQTQTLIDCLKDTVKEIVGMPNNGKGLGGGASGNVGSVIAWQGWEICEARTRETELLFKKSERLFLRHVLKILRDTVGTKLKLADIDVRFARRNLENLLVKTQALQNMLTSGIEPEAAIATIGLWSDPMDIAQRSKPYLKKWEVSEQPTTPTPGGGGAIA